MKTTRGIPTAPTRTIAGASSYRRFLAMTVMGLVSACAGMSFSTAGRPTTLAPQDRTFALLAPEAPPAPYHPSAMAPEIRSRVAPLLRARMIADGFVERPASDARLLVRFGAGVRRHPEQDVQGGAGAVPRSEDFGDEPWDVTDVDDPAYTDAALVIDVADRAQHRKIWRGGAYAEIDPTHVDPVRLERAVDGLVDRFANATGASSPQ